MKRVDVREETVSIGEDSFAGCDALTIYGFAGSKAEEYAKENGIPFKSLGGNAPTPASKAKIELNMKKVTVYADAAKKQKSFASVTLVAKLQGVKGDVVFASSAPKVVAVDSKTGVISPLSKGKAKITASLKKDGSVKASCTVIVKNPSWTVKESKVTVKKGKTYKLGYTLKKPKAGHVYLNTDKCKKIVKTDIKDGYIKITGIKKGKGKLTLLYGNQKKTITVTVK